LRNKFSFVAFVAVGLERVVVDEVDLGVSILRVIAVDFLQYLLL